MLPNSSPPAVSLTVSEVAKRYRISRDKVRGFITRGELVAVNVAATLCGRPRFVITPEALARFEKRREAAFPPKPQRRKKPTGLVDFFPD
jgi:hypothetical protein